MKVKNRALLGQHVLIIVSSRDSRQSSRVISDALSTTRHWSKYTLC